jgi:orotate phosphoribosyltransferase
LTPENYAEEKRAASSWTDDVGTLVAQFLEANSKKILFRELGRYTMGMLTTSEAKSRLLALLREKSVSYGDFTLASGAKSTYYIDCRLTTLDPEGAWLVGQVMYSLIRAEAGRRGVKIDSVGGLTMGADPIALSIGMFSFFSKDPRPVRSFVVRKAPKAHGQTKLIEGNFKQGDSVVVLDDVITRGDSTINAINAVIKEGGKIAFAAVLVDRQQGGREKIESMGYNVISAFQRDDLVNSEQQPNA